MKKQNSKQELTLLCKELEQDYARWEEIKDIGCYDACHADGVNMNLKRNHVLYKKSKIKELCDNGGWELPDIFHRPLPPKVSMEYMARPNEIVKNARNTLAVIKSSREFVEFAADPDCRLVYPYTMQRIAYLETQAALGIEGDLVRLRIHEKPQNMLSELRNGIEKARQLERKQDTTQLLFAF